MENNNGKRIGLYISEDLLARCDAAVEKTNADSRSEFICDAVEHYLAVLNAHENSRVLTPALGSVIGGKIAGTEDRISRILFKLAVEQAITMNVVAATCNISREQLDKLRGTCVAQVKRTNGAYSFEDAFDFQKR